MEIRLLTPSDADCYFRIRLEALKNNPEAFAVSYEEEKSQTAQKYKERFQAEGSFTFGAFEGDQLVGTITLVKETLYKLRHRANIFAMYVAQDRRGLGIGKKLLEAAINKARELDGVEQIYLTVVATNLPAKRLYSSFGFEVFSMEKRAMKLDDVYLDEEHMVLFIY